MIENKTKSLGDTRVPRRDSIVKEHAELMEASEQVRDRLLEIKSGLVADEKDTYPMNVLELAQISQLLNRIVENSKR